MKTALHHAIHEHTTTTPSWKRLAVVVDSDDGTTAYEFADASGDPALSSGESALASCLAHLNGEDGYETFPDAFSRIDGRDQAALALLLREIADTTLAAEADGLRLLGLTEQAVERETEKNDGTG